MADADGAGGALSYVTADGGRYGLTTGSRQPGEGDSAPSWSPGGTKLVFTRSAGADSSVWVVGSNGSGLHELNPSRSRCHDRDPSWSPSGSEIVFTSRCDANGVASPYDTLLVMATDGSNVAALGAPPNSTAPAWSPDGGYIVFSSETGGVGGRDLYVMRRGGGQPAQLTTTSGDDTDPSWSPDGHAIAFRSDRRPAGIYTMTTQGTDVQLAATAAAQPSWS
jgi:TolB protein